MIKLLEFRTEKELSQRQMSKIMNISQGTYNNWENAKTQPSIEQLIALAKFFGVTIDELVGFSESEQTNYTVPPFQEDERYLLQSYRGLPVDTQKLVLAIIEKLKN